MSLDYGYRSKCCFAPIRFGWKKNNKTGIKKQILICCRCSTRDVEIVSKDDPEGQKSIKDAFAEE